MPSPFPGMDPWLEARDVWRGFHDKLVVYTVEQLQPQLRSRGYYIDLGERVWLAEVEQSIIPDDVVYTSDRQTTQAQTGAGVAVDEPVRIARPVEEVREIFANVHLTKSHRLVTGIEFISPANKSRSKGRRLYRRKQRELRKAGVNLVEVDLLRAGRHVLDVAPAAVDALRPWDYLANLVRRNSGDYEVYPIHLRNRLPRIRIPLIAGHDDAGLDLQAVFERAYDIGPYPERLNYQADPVPPLGEEDAAWADELLRSKGLRQ